MTQPRPISKNFCDTSQQVSDALKEWYDADRLVSFAHVQGPLRFGADERADVVKILRGTMGRDKDIFYMVNSQQDVVDIQARLQPGDASAADVLPDARVYVSFDNWDNKMRELRSDVPTLLLFDVEETWGAGFCLDMLKLALLAQQWASQSNLRVLWLSSAPWDTLLSRIMAFSQERDGVSTSRICLPGTRESIERLRWTAYDGPLSEGRQLDAIAKNIVEDHRSLGNNSGPSVVLFTGEDENDLKSAIQAAGGDTSKAIVVEKTFTGIGHWPAEHPPVRHLVLQDRHVRKVWDRRLRQVVETPAAPSVADIRAQAATVYVDGLDPAAVMVHASVPVERLGQTDQPRKFEEIHLESLIVAAMQLNGANLDALQETLLSDHQRWEAAMYRAKLAGFIVRDDTCTGGYAWPAESSRTVRAIKWMKHVAYDFSLAHLLSAIDGNTSRAARDALLDIAAILASAERLDDEMLRYGSKEARQEMANGMTVGEIATKMDSDCYGIPRSISATGSLWMALGMYRKVSNLLERGSLKPEDRRWTAPSGFMDVKPPAVMHARQAANQFRGICATITPISDGEQIVTFTQKDVDFIRHVILTSWVDRLVLCDYKNTLKDGAVYDQPLSSSAGFLPGESFSAMHDGTAFIVGTACFDTCQMSVLQNPTFIPSKIVRTWLEVEGLSVDDLRPPIYNV
ncbi:hypothetical protein LX32DRAFT_650422 [Colletotrichum zoysiae]|uniref:Uncharacterized protein n=1 Tax=Colletotrichum zoysiae TaxID=1216348 RepID=A0AAD9HMG2_9PEZI|nr:hypothetical protein LX32DRAFT_650422 [Colletotrichum zoysiae]